VKREKAEQQQPDGVLAQLDEEEEEERADAEILDAIIHDFLLFERLLEMLEQDQELEMLPPHLEQFLRELQNETGAEEAAVGQADEIGELAVEVALDVEAASGAKGAKRWKCICSSGAGRNRVNRCFSVAAATKGSATAKCLDGARKRNLKLRGVGVGGC
jgi:hypothetical protein